MKSVKRKHSSLKFLLHAATTISVLAVVLSLPVHAQNNTDFNDDRRNDSDTRRQVLPDNGINNLTSQPRISRRQASSIASSRYEGRVLSILMDNNTNNWRVRMDRDGTVFNVFVNASSGAASVSSD